jgi:alanine racemase
MLYNSVLTVDLSNIAANAQNILRSLAPGTKIIPVLKADAYGFGAIAVYRALRSAIDFDTVAVAHVSEAVALRDNGCDTDILLLGGVLRGGEETIVANNITPAVFSPETVRAIADETARQNREAYPVQIKLDTGLARFGARTAAQLDALADTLKSSPRLRVTGAYAHVSLSVTVDPVAAERELELFLSAVSRLEARGITIPTRHLAASALSEWYPTAHLDAVRIGRRLYMEPPPFHDAPPMSGDIAEAASWRGSVLNVINLKRGESAGYGGTVTAERDMTIAILSAGYGDGALDALARVKAPVLINGVRARLVASYMDSCVADVTGLPCAYGDEVVFFGKSQHGASLSIRETAASINEEGVYLTSRLSQRVERVYFAE